MTHDRQHLRIAGIARAFVVFALGVPVLWARDGAALIGLLAIAMVWVAITLGELRRELPIAAIAAIDAIAVGAVGAACMDESLAVLGALAVPPFTSGIYRGLWGAIIALSAELAALVGVALGLHGAMTPDQSYGAVSWTVAGLGVGLIGSFLQSALGHRSDPLAPYVYAQDLLRQLIDISGGLDSGLDPVVLGGGILNTVCDELPTSAIVLHVPRGDALTPLVTRVLESRADLALCDEAAVATWAEGDVVVAERRFAFPLRGDSGVSAIVSGVLSDRVDAGALGLETAVRRLAVQLRPNAVHLDTALLFAAFRASATAEERRRLAREMHDGVAQDIASLGYLVDALAAGAADPKQAELVAVIRDRITEIVAEIRRSLVNLRTSIGTSESLGAAIASIARNLSEVSGVPIHVIADETTDRLRPEVEGELFRIAQEAMNNAVKHARASAIEVHCQVRAPAATITVSDDGRGLQPGRRDSHGLQIMRERARLVGATLDISDRAGGGVAVSVTIPHRDLAGDAADSPTDRGSSGVTETRVGA